MIEIEPKGSQNDFWHVAERHEDENDFCDGVYFEIVNYARHERIYLHWATQKRAEIMCELLNKEKY